ncbi:MAG TPA: bifunctional diaminohydroxyphosphoribosylaminopyrimidine deaminase/5-amino-6-(5-phosphoribosylamino)uracil reductase RibD [Bdellovibrionota bacterium]|jgi:diaminohydroxyphosphoribosylaminopyrimidine deaminase/5-amino-6-(5-phosphoribosylamino)uracil reductase|nr:bifunctional diaminohydroxyphosphoribosylaminopyrimidine deaminase/5-amino-6-(5-phosphoribosylamino)uracil reductase RibD [Bdellovibrionota bacterium]
MFSPEDLMVVALSEAVKVTKRAVLPNPRVGAAILTKEGKLYFAHHKRAGEPHAEIEAMAAALDAGASLAGATIAVTLEPCAHVGKTPPCADALIRAGFAKVIVGVQDPDPRVSGEGIRRLREAGIEVVENLLEDRCTELNKEWLHAKRTGLPYVYLKMATSLDGLWTAESGVSKWITGLDARSHAQSLRAEVGAMVTSLKTVATDDPLFTARDVHQEPLAVQPDLYVLSRQVEWGDAWGKQLYKCQQVPGRRVNEYRDENLSALLEAMFSDGHMACMIEAGPQLSTVFLEENLVQELWHYQGARYLGGNGKRLGRLAEGQLPGLELEVQETRRFDDGDLWVRSLIRTRP